MRHLFGNQKPLDNLRIIITRHGERVDFTLGKDWLVKLQQGARDPRIPHLTPRPHFSDWTYDSPLTVNGENKSAHIGRKLLALGLPPIDYCYSSPAYRSVQTANRILEAQGRKDVPILIEPGLFECAAWYDQQPLVFVPPEYLARDRRFNVDPSYAPFYENIDPYEDEQLYYRRSRRLIRDITRRHKREGGTILLSAHGGSIEAVTRGLRGLLQRRGRPEYLIQEALRVSYGNFAILERDAITRQWTVRTSDSEDSPYGLLALQTQIPLHTISTEPLRDRKHKRALQQRRRGPSMARPHQYRVQHR